jgi:hypothetical protein
MFDLKLLTSDVPDLSFSFARPACCTCSCTFSIGIPYQWKATGPSKVEGAATQWKDALAGMNESKLHVKIVLTTNKYETKLQM